MSEYAVGVFLICLITGACLSLAHGSGKAQSLALGIITLWVILSPISDLITHFDPDSLNDLIEIPEYDGSCEMDYIIEDAFAEGIARAVAEKYSLDRENIRVRLYGFDKTEMRAEKIMIILSGRAALADYKAVEKYIEEMEVGECNVEIEIGGGNS
jgi:hypothetical protein